MAGKRTLPGAAEVRFRGIAGHTVVEPAGDDGRLVAGAFGQHRLMDGNAEAEVVGTVLRAPLLDDTGEHEFLAGLRGEGPQQRQLFVEEAFVRLAAMEPVLERRDEFSPPPTAVDAGEAGLDAVGGRVGEDGFVKPLLHELGPESAGGAAAGGLCGKSVRRAKSVEFGVKVFRTHAKRVRGGDQVVTAAEFLAEGGMVGGRQLVTKEGMTSPVVVGGQAMLWPNIGGRTGAEAGGQFTLKQTRAGVGQTHVGLKAIIGVVVAREVVAVGG